MKTKSDAGQAGKGSELPVARIATRLVLNFPGFEQTSLEHQLGRLQNSAEQTGRVWGFRRKPDAAASDPSGHHAVVESLTEGGNWQVRTKLVQFSWNDIVAAYEREPFPRGFFRNLPKFLAFFLDGTTRRYRKASLRYWGFTIFPILLIAIFCLIAYGFLWQLLPLLGLAEVIGMPLRLALAALLVLGLCKYPGDALYLNLTIADWGFARDMVLRTNPEIEARFDAFAAVTAREIRASRHDEIIVVGHSFGSIWAVAALARALDAEPGLIDGKRLTFLALGSSILKIALAPKAEFLRNHLETVIGNGNLFWHEIQTKDDWIAFYKSDPFAPAGIKPPKKRYQVDRIRFKKGMAKSRYRSMRKSFYRTHRQYILYYDQRVAFDFVLRLFGPFEARSLARSGKPENLIDANGRVV